MLAHFRLDGRVAQVDKPCRLEAVQNRFCSLRALSRVAIDELREVDQLDSGFSTLPAN